MNRVDKNLSEIFDIELTETDKPLEVLAIEAKQKDIDSLEKQREYVKNNIIGLIERGKGAIDRLRDVADSTEKARDYEVFFSSLKTLVDMNKDLLDAEVVHKNALTKPDEGSSGQSAKTINNQQIVFNGSTEELQKSILSGLKAKE